MLWHSGSLAFFNLPRIFPFQRKQSIPPDPNFNKQDLNQNAKRISMGMAKILLLILILMLLHKTGEQG